MSKLKVDELEESTSGSNITVNTGSDLIVDDNIQLGHDSDTTLARASAGDISVEGNAVYRASGTDVPITDGGTGASSATAAASALGVGTEDSPQFTAVNVGNASDTTLSRASAGVLQVESSELYMAGGTDVAVADGGTGAGTATAGFDALSPMTTVGDIMYGGSSGTVTRLAASTDGYVLTATGAGSAPAWEAAAGGASIDVANVGFKTIAGGNVTIAADTTSNIGTFTAGTTLPGGWFYVCYANEVEHANSNESAVANVSTSKRTSGTYNQSLEVLKSYADNSPADTGGWLMSGATLQLRNPYDASRIFRYCIYRVFGTDDNDGFS